MPKSFSTTSNISFGLLRCAAVLVSASATAAQAQAVQPWPDVIVSAPVAKGVLVSGEVIGRIADDQRTSQLETRLQVGHAFSQKITAWIGWVHVESYNPGVAPRGHENQLVEQLNWTIGNLGPVHVLTRTRLEQRYITRVNATSWRWRLQVRAAMPLRGTRAPSAILWIEPFIALNETTAQRRTLDQLRSFAGIAIPVTPRVDLEVGYLNQRIYRLNTTIVNHAVPIVLTVRL